ncbi:hypothetical protein B0T25DRAFT_504738 [Lasiosphaeria hispida]|uniref:Uncharacterized protein n=1 Tax=Lasiosphaeria hispida TaxID=260671 RepID=A0AAJ0MCF5_9PEZI|nr:hypothetical protein B0T25DRAFT_504738 [Lasiosphaeria hispida]
MAASFSGAVEEAPRRASHWQNLPWKHVAWRFAICLVFCIILAAVLYIFEGIEILDKWERRGFNTLSILFSSLVSLSLGSLLGLLGGMLRWPLLARSHASPRDGVTVEYPAMVTDWSSQEWFSLPVGDLSGTPFEYNKYESTHSRMNDYAVRALLTSTIGFNTSEPSSQQGTESVEGLTRTANGYHVVYSYPFREFHGNISSQSDNMILSSSNCTVKAVAGSTILEIVVHEESLSTNETIIGDIDHLPPGSLNISAILEHLFGEYNDGIDSEEYFWASQIDWARMSNSSSTCLTTAIIVDAEKQSNETGRYDCLYFECDSCLSGTDSITPPSFNGLSPENSTYVSNILLMLGAFQADSDFVDETYSTVFRPYIINSGLTTLLTNLGFSKDFLDVSNDFRPLREVPHLVARLPILAMVGAEGELPKIKLVNESSTVETVYTKLGVRWERAISVLVAILGGQIVVSAAVLFWCKQVFIPDYRSPVSTANLLKTIVGPAELSGVEEMSELATILEAEKKPIEYRSKTGEDGQWCGAELRWSSN